MKLTPLIMLAAVASLALGPGCSRPGRVDQAATEHPPALSLERYPKSAVLAIATVNCRLQAARTIRVTAPGTGRLHLLVPPEKHQLEKNELWAVFDPATLEADAAVVAARRAALAVRRQHLLEIEVPRHRLDLEDQIAETRRLQDIARRLGTDDEIRRSLAEFLPPTGMPAPGDLAGYDRRTSLLDLEIASVDATPKSELAVGEAELRQSETELAAKQASHELRAPFAGELGWNISAQRNEPDYNVTAGELVAVIRQTDAIECEVRMQDSRWVVLPTESLVLAVSSPGGRKVRAPFVRSRLREEQQQDAVYYIFQIPPDEAAEFNASGSALLPGEILELLPQEARIVPKIELLRAYPDVFDRADWAGGVPRIWPGAHVQALGNAYVAIREPPGRK